MNKLILAGAIALCGAVNAQKGFKLGAHVGLPVGIVSSATNFTAGGDVSYLWPIATEFNLGVTTGYSAFFLKDGDTVGSVPIAASGQYLISPKFSVGVDLGYGLLFGNGLTEGRFYYQPKAAYHFGPSEVYLGYAGLSGDGSTISAINLGYAYSFGK